MSSRSNTPPVAVETALRAGLWSVLLAVVAFTRTDPDLWGHVRFGLDVLRDGALQTADPYSFTSDRQWVNHEWAAELLSGVAFTAAGGAGLVVLKLMVIGAALLLLNRALHLDGILSGRRRDWVGALAVVTTVQQAHHIRPQIFSLLFFALLLTCLMSSADATRRRWLLGVPVLFAVWANFHGGWIVGGGVLVLWAMASFVAASPGDRGRISGLLLAVGAASLTATLVNPYGVGLWRFLWETVGFDRADIGEWQPVYAMDPSVWIIWILTATLAALAFFRGRSSLQLTRVLTVSALAIGSFFVNRLLGFFALSTAMLFGAALLGAARTRTTRTEEVPAGGARVAGLVISSVMVIGGLLAIFVNASCIRIDSRNAPEPGALAALRNQHGGNRLLVWFDWGQYAIWHLAPSMRVSIDGRRETVYSASLQNRHLRFFFDAPGGADLARDLAADYVWIPSALPAARRLKESGWGVLYEGERSVIFTRPGLPPSPVAAPTTLARARCFPNP